VQVKLKIRRFDPDRDGKPHWRNTEWRPSRQIGSSMLCTSEGRMGRHPQLSFLLRPWDLRIGRHEGEWAKYARLQDASQGLAPADRDRAPARPAGREGSGRGSGPVLAKVESVMPFVVFSGHFRKGSASRSPSRPRAMKTRRSASCARAARAPALHSGRTRTTSARQRSSRLIGSCSTAVTKGHAIGSRH